MANAVRSRIKRLRQKARDGKATQEEIQEVADYDATKSKKGRAPAPSPADEVSPSEEIAPTESGEHETEGAPVDETPDLEPPPIPHVALGSDTASPSKRGGGGGVDWRAKYGHGRGPSGREGTCVMLASYWHAGLMRMAEEIVESGGKPVYNPDTAEARALIVLAVDEILPAHITVAPKMIAGVATTGLLAQRAMRGKELKRKRDMVKTSPAFRPETAPAPPPPTPQLPSEPEPVKLTLVAQAQAPSVTAPLKPIVPEDGKPVL
jgi:hypothetical protein